MYFDSFEAFIEMGGHGLYVWVCYFVAFVVMVYNIVAPMTQKNAVIKRLRRNVKRESQTS